MKKKELIRIQYDTMRCERNAMEAIISKISIGEKKKTMKQQMIDSYNRDKNKKRAKNDRFVI